MATVSAGIKWVNIKSKRRGLTSAQKSNPSHENFGENFPFNLIRQNVTHVSFIFSTQSVLLCPWKTYIQIITGRYCKFLHMVSTMAYQTKFTHQYPPPHSCLFPSLIRSPTKQSYSKEDNSRKNGYTNVIFTSNFY